MPVNRTKVAQAFADIIERDPADETLFDAIIAGDMSRAIADYSLDQKEADLLYAIALAFAEFEAGD